MTRIRKMGTKFRGKDDLVPLDLAHGFTYRFLRNPVIGSSVKVIDTIIYSPEYHRGRRQLSAPERNIAHLQAGFADFTVILNCWFVLRFFGRPLACMERFCCCYSSYNSCRLEKIPSVHSQTSLLLESSILFISRLRLSSKSVTDNVSIFNLCKPRTASSIICSCFFNALTEFSISSLRHETQSHVLPTSC